MERYLADPVKVIELSRDENPSTGYVWSYRMKPEGVIKAIDDRYVSDPNPGNEPICGLGGTHFWKFEVVGKGLVEIEFVNARPGCTPDMGEILKYECDGEKAYLVDMQLLGGMQMPQS